MSLHKLSDPIPPNPTPHRTKLFEWLHGRPYVLDGVHGTLKLQMSRGDGWARLYHEPSERGKNTSLYQTIKAEMGDDWSTDLTDDIERYCHVANDLGYYFESDHGRTERRL